MKKFSDLEFKEHSVSKSAKEAIKKGVVSDLMFDMVNSKQAVITFDNGKKLSVLCGSSFYSDGLNTYECMELNKDSEPQGYLTVNEVNKLMEDMQNESN